MSDIITTCLLKEGQGATDRILLQCAIEEMNNVNVVNNITQSNPARQIAVIIGASAVFFMQAGFAMVCAGSVRRKNVQNTMLKNLLDACGASVAFFAVGYALAFGGSDPTSSTKTFIGTSNFFLYNVQDFSFWTFQYAFSAASATIVAGALSERCQMVSYIAYSILLSGLVYPVVAHALWDAQGFLSAFNVQPLFNVGMIDFAGSAVVHVTGGVTALIAATIIGPRRGR
jgi:ammonium transporter, Amt family